MVSNFCLYSWSFTCKDGNGVAHSLTKYALDIPNFKTLMEEAPEFLLPFLQVDSV